MNEAKVAIVIFVVGDNYIKTFNLIFKNSVEKYCKRHNYDLHLLTELLVPLEPFNKKKFFWQRFLIPSLPQFQKYDYVVTMDSDIYINENAPPFPLIHSSKIGVINERKYLENYDWREMVQRRLGWEATGIDWYKLSGENMQTNDHINGGVIIYQPKYHGELFKKLYNENIDNYMKYHQDDQSFLSLYGIHNDCLEWLDQRYNRVWFFWKEIMYPEFDKYPQDLKIKLVKNFIKLNWLTHWTGMMDVNVLMNAIQ
jgi:hypothetical protein